MKRIIATVALAAALATGITVTAPADTVEAGASCYPARTYRSGNYWTYQAYGSGGWFHRVAVVKNGHWVYGPWRYGNGYSTVTLYHGSRGGTPVCQVFSHWLF